MLSLSWINNPPPPRKHRLTICNVAMSFALWGNLWKMKPDTFGALSNNHGWLHTHTSRLFGCWRWKISHSGWQLHRRIPVLFKKVQGDLQGSVRLVNQADASSRLQPGPWRKEWWRKVCYIYGSIPWRGQWYFFHCCQGYFNEIGPFLINGRDNGACTISILVWHAWHAAVRLSEYDGEAVAQIGCPALNKNPDVQGIIVNSNDYWTSSCYCLAIVLSLQPFLFSPLFISIIPVSDMFPSAQSSAHFSPYLSLPLSVHQAYPLSTLAKKQPTVLVICGPDQNGSIGLVCARHLRMFVSKLQVHQCCQ